MAVWRSVLIGITILLGLVCIFAPAAVPWLLGIKVTGNEPIFPVLTGIGGSLIASGLFALFYWPVERNMSESQNKALKRVEGQTSDAVKRLETMIRDETNTAIEIQKEETNASISKLELTIRNEAIAGMRSLLDVGIVSEELLASNIRRVFNSRDQDGYTANGWYEMLSTAKYHYRVLGVANHGYKSSTVNGVADFADAFLVAIKRRKVDVEILWLDPNSDTCACRDREEGRETSQEIRETILWFWEEIMEKLDTNEEKARLKLKVYNATPSCGITWHDSDLVVVHYLAGVSNKQSPGFDLEDDAQRYIRLKSPSSASKIPIATFTDKYKLLYTNLSSTSAKWGTHSLDAKVVAQIREDFIRNGGKP